MRSVLPPSAVPSARCGTRRRPPSRRPGGHSLTTRSNPQLRGVRESGTICTAMTIAENLEHVRERIARAAERVGRDASDVTIVVVTKTFGADVVEEAIRAGVADIGENKVQEFLEKAPAVKLPCRWHLVGHLQTNKVPKVIGRFALIQSVDSLRLAERLSAAGDRAGVTTEILLEVNTSGEESKYGLSPKAALDECARIAKLPSLRIRGLMTVGPLVSDPGSVAAAFATLRRVRDQVAAARIENVSMEHLSMGMTDDFEIAIAEGSTMVRLGRVLLGERKSIR
jgi:pyridoxal phosphate enzyme (YggS family)